MFDWELDRLSESQCLALALTIAKKGDRSRLRWHSLEEVSKDAEQEKDRNTLPSLGVLKIVEGARGVSARLDETFQKWSKSPTPAESRVRGFILVARGSLHDLERSKLRDFISGWAKSLSWTTWQVWDEGDLHEYVSRALPLLRPYFETLAPSNFLERVPSVFSRDTAAIVHALAIASAADLMGKQWVRTGDSGYGDGSKMKLADIAIDLPCSISQHRYRGVVQEILQRASEPAGSVRKGPGGEIIVGGPGQGKSTVAQLIAHAFRIALLEGLDREVVGERAHTVKLALESRLTLSGVDLPTRRRWPVLIDLAELGPKAADIDSLLSFIATGIAVDGKPIEAPDLLEWIRYWPVVLILDGLDEVPEHMVRSQVIELLAAFFTLCSANGVDLHVIATTRPQGYQNEFEDLLQCTRVTLVELTETEALAYSDEVNGLRNANDPELAAQVTERLIDAVHRRHTQRLMTTPLQVTIMTALAERAVDLPTTRYELFDDYYQTVYDRELAKDKSFAGLRTHRSHVDHLHEQSGLALEKRSEGGSSSDALLSRAEVVKLLVRRLVGAGFEEGDAKFISEELLKLSTDRLVMLVSPRVGWYGFEVRSLQEYMAARALSEGDDEDVLRTLQVLLPSAHWRNTWLLMVGRVLENRERLRPRVLAIVKSANTSDPTGLLLTGSLAALDLYLDQIAAEFPADRRELLEAAIELCADFEEEVPKDISELIDVGLHENPESETIVLTALDNQSSQSDGNLASLYLETHRQDLTPLAMRPSVTLANGRKWERGTHRDSRERNFVLSEYLRQYANGQDEVIELANLLSGEIPGLTATGIVISAELLAGLAPKAAHATLLRVAVALRYETPDIAQQAIRMLRGRVESAPQSQALDQALKNG